MNKKMARTDISFGHKRLTDVAVVREQTREAGDLGSSASGREARVFRMKNRVTCALRRATCGCLVGSLPVLKKSLFFSPFFRFSRNHISVDILEPVVLCTPITAGLVVSV
jgi:hypothetical protein